MADITVKLNESNGTFKKLHGVNNGPVTYGSLVNVTKYYQKVEIPLVRLHDPNWPHPREIDIHHIFPDMNKDPLDPANYDFSTSDEYMRTVVNTGADVLVRLGESIEHTDKKYFVHPPQDYQKWAEVCIQIIRHYNEGWADGFHYGITYWEIWNEPDNPPAMWSGTPEDYYRLYEVAASAIKQAFPQLKVGGPALARPYKTEFADNFLAYVRDRKLPLDFYSWHAYTSDVKVVQRIANYVREHLDQYGFEKTESHFNEWNYFEADFRTIWNEHSEFIRRRTFERAKNEVGAAYVASVLTALQDLPVDHANYYDGQPTAVFCGLFDYYGAPRKAYHAFEAFYQITKLPERVVTAHQECEGLYTLAGKDEQGSSAVMISNYEGKSRFYSIKLEGLSVEGKLKMLMVDSDHDFTEVEPVELNGGEISLWLPQHSVVLLKVDQAG